MVNERVLPCSCTVSRERRGRGGGGGGGGGRDEKQVSGEEERMLCFKYMYGVHCRHNIVCNVHRMSVAC